MFQEHASVNQRDFIWLNLCLIFAISTLQTLGILYLTILKSWRLNHLLQESLDNC